MDIPVKYIIAAQKAQRLTGILSSVQLAQWYLESGDGKHEPAGSNNPFGIKETRKGYTGSVSRTEEDNGGVHHIEAGFRIFASEDEAFAYHANLLAHGKPYASLAKCKADAKLYCQGLTGIYATDPEYGDKLCKIIDRLNLTQYDKLPAPVAPLVGVAAAGVASAVTVTVHNLQPQLHHYDYTTVVIGAICFCVGALTVILWAIAEHYRRQKVAAGFAAPLQLQQGDDLMAFRPSAQPVLDAITALQTVAGAHDEAVSQVATLTAQLATANATIASLTTDDTDTDAALLAAAQPVQAAS
jgi:hypothetical protein